MFRQSGKAAAGGFKTERKKLKGRKKTDKQEQEHARISDMQTSHFFRTLSRTTNLCVMVSLSLDSDLSNQM
jgi:hypothetical protein